jgi:hypothetical protein
MTGLLDIAPVTRVVVVHGHDVEVKGISAAAVAYLLDKFPAVKSLMARGQITDTEGLLKAAPDVVAAIIAAGTGATGDAKSEAAAAALPLEAQFDLVEAIMAITMPSGFTPFVDRLSGLIAGNQAASKSNGHDAGRADNPSPASN